MASRFNPLFLAPLAGMLPILSFAHPIPVQLAEQYQNQDVSQYLMSEKYDGVRAYWDGHKLWTRHGRLIHAPRAFIQNFPNHPLDGELWTDYNHFSEIAALLEREQTTDADWQNVHYMVFDLPADPAPFHIRYQNLQKLREQLPPTIHILRQYALNNRPALDQALKEVTAHGGEGVVLHLKNAFYQAGRSGHLLKYKPFHDDEATITGYLPGHGKYQGLVGAFKVKTQDGTTFAIGSGLTDEMRRHPLAIGSIITFRYNGRTRYGKPRFARFLRLYHPL